MLKKVIILSLFLICLTGCQIEYKLDFKDDNLTENISIILDSTYTENDINTIKRSLVLAINDAMGQSEYNINYENIDKGFKANYDYKYHLTEYNRSSIINQCYEAVGFVKNGDNYILSTSSRFQCMVYEYFDIDNVKISISTNRQVIENNADYVDNGSYIWNIDKSNANNKPIKIVFGTVYKKKSWWNILKEINPLYLFLILVILVGTVITVTITLISRKNNKI